MVARTVSAIPSRLAVRAVPPCSMSMFYRSRAARRPRYAGPRPCAGRSDVPRGRRDGPRASAPPPSPRCRPHPRTGPSTKGGWPAGVPASGPSSRRPQYTGARMGMVGFRPSHRGHAEQRVEQEDRRQCRAEAACRLAKPEGRARRARAADDAPQRREGPAQADGGRRMLVRIPDLGPVVQGIVGPPARERGRLSGKHDERARVLDVATRGPCRWRGRSPRGSSPGRSCGSRPPRRRGRRSRTTAARATFTKRSKRASSTRTTRRPGRSPDAARTVSSSRNVPGAVGVSPSRCCARNG